MYTHKYGMSARVASRLRPSGQTVLDFTTQTPGGPCVNDGDTFVDSGPSGDTRYVCTNATWVRAASQTAAPAPAPGPAPAPAPAPAAPDTQIAQGVFSSLSAALGMTGTALTAALTSGGETERARIRAEAERFRLQLLAQNPNTPGLAQQLLATNSLIGATTTGQIPPMFLPPPGPSPLLIVGVLGAVAIGAYLVLRKK